LILTRPVGGEAWETDSVQTIEWETVNLDDVVIRYSVGGEYRTIAPSLAWPRDADVWGSYPWTVPDEETEEATVLIHGYFDEAVRAESGRFSIVPAGTHPADGGTDEEILGECGCRASPGGAGLLLALFAWAWRVTRR
jgi:hypothetical protein